MEAIQGLLGWRQPVGGLFNISLEGYYKQLSNIPVPAWSTLAKFTSDLAAAEYGGDIRLEFDTGVIYGFLGYGLLMDGI